MKLETLLLQWYQENKRALPWRENKDPYRVWVSEIMLQQTRVEAVKPYFYRFMETLPTIQDLANAKEDVLHKLWEGLGYYSRIRNMHRAAQICCEKGEGLPSTYEALLALPGIGPYTAGAIASIAFKQPVCAIDGNVLRVFARVLDLHEDILAKKAQTIIRDYLESNLAEDMGEFNQAVMDLGSSICVANGSVRCNICPLQSVCLAYQRGTVEKLPIRIKKLKRSKEKYTVCIYMHEDKVLLHKRPAQGLLANLYEFVLVEGHMRKSDFDKATYLGAYKHVFSHKDWHMKGFLIPCDYFEKEGYFWATIEEIQTLYSIPGAFKPYKESLLQKYCK